MNRKTFILTLMLLMVAGLSTWAQNVAKIGETEYATLEAAFSNVKSGQIIYLLSDFDASTTNFTGCNNKNVIIAGRTGTEVLNMGTGHKGGLTGCTITFLNLKMQIRHDPTTGTWYTQGLNHANKIRYDKVTFDGCVATYDDVEFLNCTFTSNPQNMEYTLWNYCGTVVLDKCTFEAESAGTKSFVKQYAEPAGSSATNLAVIDTEFIEPTEKNKDWKGCYIYESTNNNAVNKIYVDCETAETATGIIGYSDDNCKNKTTICQTLAEFGIEDHWSNFTASTFKSLNESAKTITISTPAELALLAKNVNSGISYAGYTITINGELDMQDHYWIPINARNDQLSGSTIQGTDNAVISNLKIEKAVYKDNYDYYAGFIAQTVGTLTVKDLNFSGAVSVDNGSGVATVLGLTYGNVLFDNVKVLNSTVTATTKAGALVGFTGGDGITVTVKNCTLENVTVKAEYSYALMVGLVNTNDHVVFEGKNEAKNSKTELDETKAGEDFPDSNGRKSINGYTYGVDDTKLWVINVKDAWAECRTNPSPTMTIDGVKYTIMGDIFYHADNVIVDVCAVAKIDNKEYRTLASAIAAVKDGETITMIANEVLTKGQTITLENNEQFTLDLNGKTISIAETGFDFTANGTNVALRNGVPARFAIVVNGNGTLNICDNSTEKLGKIETKNYAYSTTKTILVDGNAIVNVNSGTIAADYAPFYVVGFTGVTAVPENAPNPTLNVNGGSIIGKDYGIAIKGATSTLVVTKGNVEANVAAISTNGTQDWYNGGNCKIYISGGTIKSTGSEGSAMYLPAEAKTEITGGTFEGATGISVKGGSLSISGDAVVNATGTECAPGAVSSGNANTGSAIYVEDTYSDHSPIVNITGGKFSSTNNKAVEYFTNKDENATDKGKVTVSGGTFSDLSGVNYVADGGTYKLADNVTMNNPLDINSGKKFVVDLNGKTLTGRTNIKHGDVTFVNGTINGGSNQALNVYGSSNSNDANYSVVTVANNVTVTANVFGVCLFGPTAGSTVGYGAVANINGTIETTNATSSNEGAVFVSGNLGSGEDNIALQSAMEGKNFVNITGSVKSTSDAALALNGSATVTIAESASLTGNTAIAAKRGKLVVNGGTITGNGVCVGNPTGNSNGTELTGSALSASSTYGAHLTIDVKGGEFTSAAYTILNNSDDDDCTFNISGGSFKTTKADGGIAVYARLGSVNITGGTFENSSNSEATLHVGCPTAVKAVNYGKSPKLTISGAPLVMNKAEGNYTYNGSWSPLTVNMANELTYKAVEISGGEFHGQSPEKDDSWTESNTESTTFLKAGYAVKGSDNVWTVVPEKASPVIAKTGDVKITDEDGENIAEVDKEQVTTTLTEATNNMTHNTEISLVYEENGSSVANDVVGADQSVGITVELTGTKVSVATGEQTPTVTLKEFTFDVTPYVVTTSDYKVVSKIKNDQITAPMTFRLPIPSSVADNCARVIHHKENGEDEDMGLYSITINNDKKYIEISTPSFSQFDIVLKNVSAPTNLSYYAGNLTEKKITDPNAFLNTKATEPNAIAFVGSEHASWAAEQTNVVVDYSVVGTNGHYYECPKFVLTDLKDFYTPVDFHVVNGSYTRENTGNLNTVCLPFELSSADVNNGQISVFHSTDMYGDTGIKPSGNVYFNVVRNVNLNPGTPCIIKCSSTDAGWNIDLAGKTVAANPNNVNALKGSYVEETIGAGVYKVDNKGEKFGKTTSVSETVVPFRAYLDLKHGSGMETNVKDLNIEWADDATGIENVKVASDSKVIYDLTGRMVNNPVKGGLYIINGKKVIFK